ncbi:MAG: hypothetical protein WCD18_20200 [Thermosynechococcaceae cyanobacterium]
MTLAKWQLGFIMLGMLLLGYALAALPALQGAAMSADLRWHLPQTGVSRSGVEIQGIGWAGTRTAYFADTVAFFRDVLGLPFKIQTPQFAEFTLPGDERLGVFDSRLPGNSFMKGPLIEFWVADVVQARSQMEAVGVRFIGPIQGDESTGLAWTQFWGPDGYPYGLTSVPKPQR